MDIIQREITRDGIVTTERNVISDCLMMKIYAYMDVGRKKIGSETYYFDKNGYKLIPDIVGDDEND